MSISDSSTNPSSIPQEIWNLLFTYLPLEDRKNVRLTCRYFYEACSTYQIQRNEKMVFYGNMNTCSAIQALSDCERKVWNIKLCEAHLLDDSVLPFFEKRGSDIRSLVLIRCVVKSETFRDILGSCPNLVSLSLYSTKFGVDRLCKVAFPEFEVFQKRNIICAKVNDLTLQLTNYDKGRSVTNKRFLQFFAIFPNIRNLDLTVVTSGNFGESNLLSSEATSDDVFSFSSIYHLLSRIGHQLEELDLQLWYRRSRHFVAFETLSKIAAIEMKNLKKVFSNCNIILPGDDPLLPNPLPRFHHLTYLHCVVSCNATQPVSAQILFILNSAPQLYWLTVGVAENDLHKYTICQKCFVALVRSQLRSFDLQNAIDFTYDPGCMNSVSADFLPSSVDDSLMPNYSLCSLGVLTDDLTLLFLFSKYFLRLESMYVRNADESILYNICNYQTKVRRLELYHCERHQNSRLWSKNTFATRLSNLKLSSSSSLDNLTHLRIVDTLALDLSRFVLSTFVLSKLTSLAIRLEEVYRDMEWDMDALCQEIQKSTRLEYLEIVWRNGTTFQQWLTLFESLPRLRHFSCTDSGPAFFDNSEYLRLFHARPSLRSIYHASKETGWCVIYAHDIISSTMIAYPRRRITRNLKGFEGLPFENLEHYCSLEHPEHYLTFDVNKP